MKEKIKDTKEQAARRQQIREEVEKEIWSREVTPDRMEIADLAIEKTAKAERERTRKAIDGEIVIHQNCRDGCEICIWNARLEILKQKIFGSEKDEKRLSVRQRDNLRHTTTKDCPSEKPKDLNDVVAKQSASEQS